MDLNEAWYLVKLTSQKGDSAEPDSYQAREVVQEAIIKYQQIKIAYERLCKKTEGDPNTGDLFYDNSITQ